MIYPTNIKKQVIGNIDDCSIRKDMEQVIVYFTKVIQIEDIKIIKQLMHKCISALLKENLLDCTVKELNNYRMLFQLRDGIGGDRVEEYQAKLRTHKEEIWLVYFKKL